jgi:RNA polymerase sigma-70 factor (ECF subfamily)
MLGSLDDADDALQETLLRAWRRLDRFEPRAPLRAWLYRIATNVCLTALARRTRRGETWWQEGELMRLDPYPDRLLDELAPIAPGPEAVVEQDESVELAFVAAVQLLPPRQRATLLLRDVIGYTAAEVAATLATSVAGVNSALQRARATLERERIAGLVTRTHSRTNSATEQALVRRLADAWHAADVPSIVAILAEDALLTMPPLPDRHVGREAIGAFLATVPGGGRLERFRLVPTRANRQPAVALYLRDGDDGPYQAHALLVLAIEGEAVASLVRFAGPDLFERFGLPVSLDG